MPKFRLEFVFEENPKKVRSREVELPLGRSEFITAMLDLEEELYQEHKDEKTVRTTTLTALENMEAPSIRPDVPPIEEGDVVWRDWNEVSPDSFDPDAITKLVEAYKPLWESGPGYGFLMELLMHD